MYFVFPTNILYKDNNVKKLELIEEYGIGIETIVELGFAIYRIGGGTINTYSTQAIISEMKHGELNGFDAVINYFYRRRKTSKDYSMSALRFICITLATEIITYILPMLNKVLNAEYNILTMPSMVKRLTCVLDTVLPDGVRMYISPYARTNPWI